MEKLTAAMRKQIKRLSSAKGRREEGLFVTERTKNVLELLESSFELHCVIASHSWYENHPEVRLPAEKCFQATTADLERISSLSTAPEVVGVFRIPPVPEQPSLCRKALYVALDGIQDPGNMGTIIRLADWFGVQTVFAGDGTVDPYNTKTVIASMGSIGRVNIVPCNLESLIDRAEREEVNVFGTFVDGENMYDAVGRGNCHGIIVMGNEGKGISPEVAERIDSRICIPCYGNSESHAESLNVATATAIILAEFRRVNLQNG